jgi:hypothetical protein
MRGKFGIYLFSDKKANWSLYGRVGKKRQGYTYPAWFCQSVVNIAKNECILVLALIERNDLRGRQLGWHSDGYEREERKEIKKRWKRARLKGLKQQIVQW